MTTLAYILLALAVVGILADAYETHRRLTRPGYREVGIPWRWLPTGAVVPGRVITGGLTLVLLACGLWAIENGVTTGVLVALGIVAALSWGAAIWNRMLD
jgi:hypothetical protein